MTLRRELQLMRAYAVVSGSALVVLATAAFQASPSRNQGEITVERINVVEKDGRTRMVIANSERQAATVINGHTIGAGRPRPAGIIFFNDNGDEDGGLVFGGRPTNGRGQAGASLTFDQFQQDQTIGLQYSEGDGQRSAGLKVWDHTDMPMDQFLDRMDAAQKLPTDAERKAAFAAIGATDNGAQRVFVGKDPDRAAVVTLADAHGKPRLALKVDAAGAAGIDFLDEAGAVTRHIP